MHHAGNVTRAAQSRGDLRTEEFHQTYPLTAEGRIALKNINGDVHIKVWDRDEVRLDAVKSAASVERLKEIEIVVESAPEVLQIHTKYPATNYDWQRDGNRPEEPGSVEYTLTVPRRARLQNIELINGAIEIADLAGDVRASSINGRVTAHGLAGEARLSTVNGSLQAVFDKLGETKPVTLGSVNGNVALVIPSDARAEIKASTVHGAIANDFGLNVRRGEYIGQDVSASLAGGGTRIRLTNVNGRIEIHHAADNRQLSPVTNNEIENKVGKINRGDVTKLKDEIKRSIELSIKEEQMSAADRQRLMNEAMREAQAAELEVARNINRTVNSATREMVREQVQLAIEATRAATQELQSKAVGDAMRGNKGARATAQETHSFALKSSTPIRVIADTFDGSITVHTWDQPEVKYTAFKNARSTDGLGSIQIVAEERAGEIYLAAKRTQGKSWYSNSSVRFEIYVPHKINLRLSSGDGRINVDGVDGEMELKTGDGAIYVSAGRGRLHATTGDGRVSVTDYDGYAEVRSGDGRLVLDGRFAGLQAQTGDGQISLNLPSGGDATIETNAESVTNDEAYIAEAPDEEKRVRRWKFGRGSSEIFKLHTGDGRIILSSDAQPKAAQSGNAPNDEKE